MVEQEKCMICQRIIEAEGVHCPYCHVAAHKNELQRWILRFGTCPRCGRALKPYAT
ncbi:MAG: hypothetical protein ACTSQI_15875 [Candidatus Helarchaeota archaeon]